MILEREIAGLRPSKRKMTWPPKHEDFPGVSEEAFREHFRGRRRYDYKEYYDYRPVGEAIEWIRGTLAIDPPQNDPFPPPPVNDSAKAVETADTEDEIAAEPSALPKRRQAAHGSNDPATPDEHLRRAWDTPDEGKRRKRSPRGPP